MDFSLSLDGLLQGVLGSLITALAALASAYLLIRHERSSRREQDLAEKAQADLVTRREAAWELVGAARLLAVEVSTPRIGAGSSRVDLLAASAKFGSVIGPSRPEVALWATALATDAVKAYGPYLRYLYLPGSKARRKRVLGLCAPLIAWIPVWIADGFDADAPPESERRGEARAASVST